jgi:hypothetical protein
MLTATECLTHARKMDDRAAENSDNNRDVFLCLARGWRYAAYMARWQDDWAKGYEIPN